MKISDVLSKVSSVWSGLSATWKGVLIGFAVGIVLMLLAGCTDGGAPSRIAKGGQASQAAAMQQKAEVQSILASTEAIEQDQSLENVTSHTGQIRQSAGSIDGLADQIVGTSKQVVMDSTRVEAKVPWWGTLLSRVSLVVLVVVVLAAAWYLGLLTFIRRIIGTLSWLPYLGQAKLDMEALRIARESGSEHAPAEAAIAAKRAASPEYDGAVAKIAKESKS
jgi:hypothetical protein